jgi:hypothetical protein
VAEAIRFGADPLQAGQVQKQQHLTGLSHDDVMSAEIASLFRQAFAPAGCNRPTALQWVHALKALHGELTACPRNSTHEYRRTTSGCPWCRLEAAGQVSFFGPAAKPVRGGRCQHPRMFPLRLRTCRHLFVHLPRRSRHNSMQRPTFRRRRHRGHGRSGRHA